MRYIWRFSSDALREQIAHLPPYLKFHARKVMDDIRENPESGKPLGEELTGYRSYRIGRYRLIYRIAEDRLVLEAFGPRSDIYERFVLEIGRQKIRERSEKYRVKSSRKRPKKLSLRRKR